PSARVGVTDEDLDAALAQTGQVLDVGRRDLAELMRRAQLHALSRQAPRAACGDVMTRDVIAVGPGDSLRSAAELMRERRLKALPVTDESARVVGIVTQSDMLEKAVWDQRGPHLGFGRRVEITARRLRAPSSRVEDIMTTPVRTLRPEWPLSEAAPLLTDDGLHHLPVVDGDGRLAGVLAQTDLIIALLAARGEDGRRPLET
ncbi:CBS domain-containing protein, partial [Methylopila musalis]